jgi:hypothetical protein
VNKIPMWLKVINKMLSKKINKVRPCNTLVEKITVNALPSI